MVFGRSVTNPVPTLPVHLLPDRRPHPLAPVVGQFVDQSGSLRGDCRVPRHATGRTGRNVLALFHGTVERTEVGPAEVWTVVE